MKNTSRFLATALLALAFASICPAQVPSGPCTINTPGIAPPVVIVSGVVYTCNDSTLLWSQIFPAPALSVQDSALQANIAYGNSPRRIAHAQYNFTADGGATTAAITPAHNFTLPANAVITNVIINSTTAATSLGSATIALGTTAGSSANSLLTATAKASFSTNAFVQGVPVPSTASTFVKLTAAGQLSVTVGTAALTNGVIEVYVEYYVSGS